MPTNTLPKTLRNTFLVLGMVMITLAGAMEQVEEWNEFSHSAKVAECPSTLTSLKGLSAFLGL